MYNQQLSTETTRLVTYSRTHLSRSRWRQRPRRSLSERCLMTSLLARVAEIH